MLLHIIFGHTQVDHAFKGLRIHHIRIGVVLLLELLPLVGVVSYLRDVIYYIDVVVNCLPIGTCLRFRLAEERILLSLVLGVSRACSLLGSVALPT